MKDKSKILALLLVGFLVYGCSEREATVKFVDDIDCDSEISGYAKDSIRIEENFNLWDWKISEGIAVLRTSEASNFIKVYTYPEFDLLYTFGAQGRGADEFITHNWCKTKKAGELSLYDIMKRSLYVFDINRDTIVKKHTYRLSENGDGLCRPYTIMLEINDSLFLMKEDFDKTVLHLTDMKRREDLSSYVCSYREENGGDARAYTAYDYDFDLIGDKVLLAYKHADRMELLQISPNNEMSPIVIMGERSKAKEEYVYLDVCTDGINFYCLKCTNHKNRTGNELIVVDVDGDISQKIYLDKEVGTIQFDATGCLVGYAEHEIGATFYRYEMNLNASLLK